MIQLRDYQKAAVEAFHRNNDSGIFDMATGTGKTFTSIVCANNFFESNQKQFLIVIVPYLHLIPQWKENLNSLGITTQVEIANSRKSWVQKLKSLVFDFDHGYRDRVVVIGSYKSTNSELFGNLINSIQLKKYGFLIADECHYLGSGSSNNLSIYKKLQAKLGLSATPRRWWDEDGTTRIFNLFGKVVFEYSLQNAIDNHFLTHYKYFPVPLKLTLDETDKYVKVSQLISRLAVQARNGNQDAKEALKRNLLKRSRIIQSADNKIAKFKDVFKKHKHDYSLVYCPDGEIKKYTSLIGNELGVRVHRFDSEISYKERTQILRQFSENRIQTLTAIRCLDEGVDVPATKIAYFISSTTNPRQFIQRRGRILRPDHRSGKKMADIYDLIVVPDRQEMDTEMARSMVKREMPRFHEFSQYADNEFDARNIIRPILENFDLDSYMDKSAWDVYQENQEEMEEP